MPFIPRPAQKEILQYTHGRMGIAAVPGSGKTHTLSYLAASLIARQHIEDDQEILIVTMSNSAVNNFITRIESFLSEFDLLPGLGYRVRTLHGLAHDIVRERPDLAGLSDRFQIADESSTQQILQSVVQAWMRANPNFSTEWLDPNYSSPANYRQIAQSWNDTRVQLGQAFIRQSKDLQLSPNEIRRLMPPHPSSLLRFGADIYSDYQRALAYRNAVDFDDLIRLALQALLADPGYLSRLRYRWPYILEDEAQDSSRLQEQILRLLVGEDGNWVRVGDPNQAIYETFTTANPRFLLDFRNEPGVLSLNLPNSGRSTRSIIALANALINWTRSQHPDPDLRAALNPPLIEPAPAHDPQPNPPDNPNGIYLVKQKFSEEDELEKIVKSLKQWLPQHPDETVAVLVTRNTRGAKLITKLTEAGLPCIEMLQTTHATRRAAEALSTIIKSLADPANPVPLAQAYQSLPRPQPESAAQKAAQDKFVKTVASLINQCKYVESYLWPHPSNDWLREKRDNHTPEEYLAELEAFRDLMRRWQSATLLPIDQLLLTIAQDLFSSPADLALAHKLALVLENSAQANPHWRLTDFANELSTIARNERKLSGFSDEDLAFDPEQHKGKVLVATMHKAKGLEWDRVYLVSVNNYDFPSNQPYDTYISEPYYVRERLNLQAELLSMLKALAANDPIGLYMEEGLATRQARLDYCAERLRLLYVGITRARKELIITWNTGRSNLNNPTSAALPLIALISLWEETHHAPAS